MGRAEARRISGATPLHACVKEPTQSGDDGDPPRGFGQESGLCFRTSILQQSG